MAQILDENFKPFLSMQLGRVTKYPLLLSKDEKLRAIGHNMNIESLILSVNSVTVSYLIHYDSLKQWNKYYNKM